MPKLKYNTKRFGWHQRGWCLHPWLWLIIVLVIYSCFFCKKNSRQLFLQSSLKPALQSFLKVPLAHAQINNTLNNQQALDFSVAPPVAYLSVKPGGSLQHTVVLTNHSANRLEVTAQLLDFKPDGSSGQIVLGNASMFDQLFSKTTGLDRPFILEPNQNKEWQIKLNINPTASQKEYPLTLLFSAKSASANFSPQVSQVQAVIGSNIILLISPNDEDKGEIIVEELFFKKLIDSLGSLKFASLVKNVGSNATSVEGFITIKNSLNHTIAEYIIYPDMVLANATRQIRLLNKKEAVFTQDGKLEPEQKTELLSEIIIKRPFLFGFYSVELNINQQTAVVQILALPLSLLAVAMLGGVIYIIFQQIKKY